MTATLVSKRNHYERLGLSPGAGEAEIARAFALAMSPLMPRSARDIAEIGLAFETLRDPARRRAYDESLAPAPPPAPPPAPKAEPLGASWRFIASAPIGSAEIPALHTLPHAEVERAPLPATQPAAPAVVRDADDDSLGWRAPALTIGGLFVAVAITGAALGWYASRGIDPAQAQDAVEFPVPRAETPAAPAPAQADPQPEAPQTRAEHGARPAPKAHASVPRQQREPQKQQAQDVPDLPSDQVAALTATAAEPPAQMPLPNAVVARTLGRIGYACGKVASTTAVDGAAGVFTVTCTSGDTYRAAPVRGRYHFRRWNGG